MIKNNNNIIFSGSAMAVLFGAFLIISTFFYSLGFKELIFWVIGAVLITLGVKN